jgi:hypothetical protein
MICLHCYLAAQIHGYPRVINWHTTYVQIYAIDIDLDECCIDQREVKLKRLFAEIAAVREWWAGSGYSPTTTRSKGDFKG